MGWQDFVAIGIVLAAAAYLLSGLWQGLRGGRTKAESCGTSGATPSKELVQLGPAHLHKP